MINKSALSVNEQTSGRLDKIRYRGLLDILIAYIPLLFLGVIGTWLGAGTLLGGMLITLGYVLTIAAASGVLKLRGSSWREIGLARPQSWPRTVLLGIGTLVGAAIVSVVVTMIALNFPGLATEPADVSRFNPMEGNLLLFLGYLLLAWTTIAFGEEMFFRAFLITRLGEVFNNTKLRWGLALVGSSVAFGLAHYQEGPVGILSTGAIGLLFGWIYLRTGRNLWVTIIAHGLLNSLRFMLVYLGAA